MSTTTLRYRKITVSFLPERRERQFGAAVRRLKQRISRRRLKQAMRSLVTR